MRAYPRRIPGAIRTSLAACAAFICLVAPAQAARPHLTWSGFAGVRIGGPLAGGAASLGRGTTVVCSGAGRVSDIHTTARGVTGPHGVRVGMSERALRKALGRHSRTFTLRGRRGRLLVGPKGHTLWALAASARRHSVGMFGIAASRQIARRAAKSKRCTAPPALTPAPVAPGPAAPAQDPAASTTQTPTDTTTTPAPTPPAPPECPATLPTVGPYMHVACDASTGNRVQYTCHPDWRDTNQDPADGCEAEKDGLQTMWFTPDSSRALADHILGSFAMDGYGIPFAPPPTSPSWGPYDGFIDPVVAPIVPDCASNPMVACAGGQPADPPPTLDIDLAKYASDSDRSYVGMSGSTSPTGLQFYGDGSGTTQAIAGARFRLTTASPIQITYNGVTCNVAIDTTQGTIPDMSLDATLAKGTDPDTGQGDDGPPQLANVTITNLQSTDYSITPATSSDYLCFGSSFITAQNVVAAIQPALTGWFKAATRLCGAAGPYWWQPCPSSVDVGW